MVLAASDLNRDVLVGYVMQYEPLTPLVEQVRHFVKPANPVLPTFNGSADTHLDAHPKVRRFGDGANGFVRYGISPRLERDHALANFDKQVHGFSPNKRFKLKLSCSRAASAPGLPLAIPSDRQPAGEA
jgi:hypothetical protein